MKRIVTLGAMVVMLGIGLAGCGDDKKTTEATSDTTATTGGTKAAVATYCKDSLAAETLPDPDIDFEAPEAEQQAVAKTFVNEELKPVVDRLKKSVPAEISAPAKVLFAAVDKVGVDGDFSVLDTPEYNAAESEVHTYDLANCGWDKVPTVGVEYSFQGIPASLDAGVTSFDFRNGGKELHEMLVLKKKDGVTDSFDDILALDEEQAKEKTDRIFSNFAPPGGTDYGVADLKAGDYVVVCLIPVGTSPDGPPPENSPPHFTKGMKTEFKVS